MIIPGSRNSSSDASLGDSLIACVLVIPFALVFGGLRGIPFWWRLIDCSFGVLGFVPLWFCRRWAMELERQKS